jgi:hypothetical protein
MDFIRTIKTLRIAKVDRRDRAGLLAEPERGRAIRLYCSQLDPRPGAQSRYELQVRGPLGVGFNGMNDGSDFIIANATVRTDDLRALRNAIDQALAEASPNRELSEESGSEDIRNALQILRATLVQEELERLSLHNPSARNLLDAFNSIDQRLTAALDKIEHVEAF